MIRLWWFLVCLFGVTVRLAGQPSALLWDSRQVDSLMLCLEQLPENALLERAGLCRNIGNLYRRNVDKVRYFRREYDYAVRAGSAEWLLDATKALCVRINYLGIRDSADIFIGRLRLAGGDGEAAEALECAIRMACVQDLALSSRREMSDAEALIAEAQSFFSRNSRYRELYQCYVTALFQAPTDHFQAIREFERFLNLSENLSPEYRYLELTVLRRISALYGFVGNSAGVIRVNRRMLENFRIETELSERQGILNEDFRYGSTIGCLRVLTYGDLLSPAEKVYYLEKLEEMMLDPEIRKMVQRPENYFIYCYASGDYQKTLKTISETPVSMRRTSSSTEIQRRRVLAQCYAGLGDYAMAYRALQDWVSGFVEFSSYYNNASYNRFRMLYELDELERENQELRFRWVRALFLFFSFVALLFASLAVYLRHQLRKEARFKHRLERMNEKVLESENLKSSFLNSICHEMRTPLSAIVGFNELLMTEENRLEPVERQEYVRHIRENAARFTELIDDLLGLARLDTEGEWEPEEFRLLPVLDAELSAFRDLALHSGVAFHLECPPDLTVRVRMMPFVRMVGNLVSNACKFTVSGSVSVQAESAGTLFRLVVEDTGPGIPPEKYEFVFGRFAKLDPNVPGTGIGLYLCRLVARRLGGDVRFDPEYRSGTRVIVEIPDIAVGK